MSSKTNDNINVNRSLRVYSYNPYLDDWGPYESGDHLGRVEVNNLVSDGVATLEGSVKSYLARRQAEEEAFEGGAT